MSEYSGFFDSVNGDRKYLTSFIAEYFASFIGNGVFPTPSTVCQVISNGNMTVSVSAGKAWINGYYYNNSGVLPINIDVADGVLKRIDRIVLQYNNINRTITAKVKKGAFASTPVAPSLQRDADIYELGLADVLVTNGAISILQSAITDLRGNSNYCGIVAGTVSQIDGTNLFAQFTAIFNEWFSVQREVLTTDVAGNLLSLINDLDADISEHTFAIASKYTKPTEGIPQTDFTTAVQNLLSKIIDASTAQKGLVQLTDSVTSTSIATAATPKNVKQAYDLATVAKQSLGSYQQESTWNGFTRSNCFVNTNKQLTLDDPAKVSSSLSYSVYSTGSGQTVRYGHKITVNAPMNKLAITKSAVTTYTHCLLLSSTSSGSIIASAAFTSNIATLEYDFQSGTTYYIVFATGTSATGTENRAIQIYSTGTLISTHVTLGGSFTYPPATVTTFTPQGSVSNVYGISKIEGIYDYSAITGYAEKLIKPYDLKAWGVVDFILAIGGGTATVSILSPADAVLKSGLTTLTDFSDIDITSYPQVKVRFNLSRATILTTSPTFSKPIITYKAASVLFDNVLNKANNLVVSNGLLYLNDGVSNTLPVEAGAKIVTGTYTGNATSGYVDRTINIGFTPKLVILAFNGVNGPFIVMGNINGGTAGFSTMYVTSNGNTVSTARSENYSRPLLTTNGFVVAGGVADQLNTNGYVYNYTAIG